MTQPSGPRPSETSVVCNAGGWYAIHSATSVIGIPFPSAFEAKCQKLYMPTPSSAGRPLTEFNFHDPRRGMMCTLTELSTCQPVEYSVILRCRGRRCLAYSATVC